MTVYCEIVVPVPINFVGSNCVNEGDMDAHLTCNMTCVGSIS